MMHDSTPPNTRSNGRSLDGIADPSDLLRQLSDLFCLPLGCRQNACRRTERCQGGEGGPPCFHEDRKFFAKAMQAGLRDTRRFWKRQRALAAEAARTQGIPLREGRAETGSSEPARVGRNHGPSEG